MHTTAGLNLLRSPYGSTIFVRGLCCSSSTDLIDFFLRCFRVGDALESLGGGRAIRQRWQRVRGLVDRCQHSTRDLDDTRLQRFVTISLPVRCVIERYTVMWPPSWRSQKFFHGRAKRSRCNKRRVRNGVEVFSSPFRPTAR